MHCLVCFPDPLSLENILPDMIAGSLELGLPDVETILTRCSIIVHATRASQLPYNATMLYVLSESDYSPELYI